MIQYPSIRTGRLELIPATLRMLISDRNDRAMLARLLDADIPASWPPELLDETTMDEFIRIQAEQSDPHFCSWYWIRDEQDRVLIGSGGIASVPGEPDTVMIGYSVLGEFQNRGYATEAVQHLVSFIFTLPGVRRIVATTYPELKASICVLEKIGFVPNGITEGGAGMEEGTIRYVLEAPNWFP